MSFGFTAIGNREQVADQLAIHRDSQPDDALKSAIADLLIEHAGKSELHAYTQEGCERRMQYVIEASGHSGPQSALSLNLTVRALYAPVTDPEYKLTPAGEAAADVVDADIVDDDEDD